MSFSFHVPTNLVFGQGAIQKLHKQRLPGKKALIVISSGKSTRANGYLDIVQDQLTQAGVAYAVFDKILANPVLDNVMDGAACARENGCDFVLGLGGGSSIDAAKAIAMMAPNEGNYWDYIYGGTGGGQKMKNKPLPIVAIPTTAGTGSEVTPFAVITDQDTGVKYPLADYELLPKMAIIDADMMMNAPKGLTSASGIDALTHALEAFVSVLASDYTNGLAIKAIELVFKYLPRSYENPNDVEAREKMHNASCIAGMAFTNAFLGLNHSMAHKLGAECHIPHGRANAILLPYVIKYNATKPTKFASFPKYKEYVADERYAKIAADTPISEAVDCLVKAIRELMTVTERPLCIKDCGVSEAEFMSKVDELSYKAFEDQCTTANPVYPLVSEIKELYREAYYGE